MNRLNWIRREGRSRLSASSTKALQRWALLLLLGPPRLGLAQCFELPTVLMDERTAESHLLAKKDPDLPARVPQLASLRKVTVMVRVDREGKICDAWAVAGPRPLWKPAVGVVRKHWRYRRFLLDWRPVVARFPVSVKFVLPQAGPCLVAQNRKNEPTAPQGSSQ